MSVWILRDEQRLERAAVRQYEPPRLSWYDFVIIIGLSIMFALVFNQSNPNGIKLIPNIVSQENIEKVSLSAAFQAYEKGDTFFVDAMPDNFYNEEHIKNAISVPPSLFDIAYPYELGEEDKNREIIIYGRTMSRHYDEHIYRKLTLRGHKNVRILQAGLSDWKKKGYPTEP